jgi:isochorismate synthase EntC
VCSSDLYDLESFFKTKLPNYKAQAALFTLLEVYNSENLSNPDQIIENKTVLLEFLTSKSIDKKEVKENIMEEFKTQDKDIRVLTYRVLLEKFNDKYSNLNENQKNVLKEFINGIDSTPKLREFYNTKVTEIKEHLNKLSKIVTDKAIQIKINEVINLLSPLTKSSKVNDDNLINLLQYYQLVEELEKAK